MLLCRWALVTYLLLDLVFQRLSLLLMRQWYNVPLTGGVTWSRLTVPPELNSLYILTQVLDSDVKAVISYLIYERSLLTMHQADECEVCKVHACCCQIIAPLTSGVAPVAASATVSSPNPYAPGSGEAEILVYQLNHGNVVLRVAKDSSGKV